MGQIVPLKEGNQPALNGFDGLFDRSQAVGSK
jgi:hypothetical protein